MPPHQRDRQHPCFGALEVPAEAVIEFPNGLIGLGGTRYTLLARDEDGPFVWLHSLDDPRSRSR